MLLKAADGVLEVAGGIILVFISPQAISRLVHALTAHELSEDPHDFVATHLVHSVSRLDRDATLFAAVYLLSHGVAKVVLVALVLLDRLWAYPWMIVLLVAFMVYQLYRIAVVRFSVGLLALTIFDGFLVWLTWREYQAKRTRRTRIVVTGV